MKVLVACEYSGTVRDAFIKKGHDAISCDLLPTEKPGPHYEGNVFDIINDGFDLMIAHPPCTYLSSAGLHYCNIEKYGQKAIDRIKKRNEAINFILDLYSTPINKICIENPLGHFSAHILKPTQIIHPYYFGEPSMKRTAIWIKNLEPLQYSLTDNLFMEKTATEKPEPLKIEIQKSTGKTKKRYWMNMIGADAFMNSHLRSKTFQSIADAMAEQWG